MALWSSRTLPGQLPWPSSSSSSLLIALTGDCGARSRARARKLLRERRYVLRARAQRRHGQRDDVEPVVEVVAESTFLHELGELAVCRGDDADVHALDAISADRSDLPGL